MRYFISCGTVLHQLQWCQRQDNYMTFEVVTVVKIQVIFWVVMLCSVAVGYNVFEVS